jgi:hypothetical protein
MTPKEKAEELINKFQQDVQIIEEDNDSERFYAKQCALIAVDEIIDTPNPMPNYWQEVKQEIEKL